MDDCPTPVGFAIITSQDYTGLCGSILVHLLTSSRRDYVNENENLELPQETTSPCPNHHHQWSHQEPVLVDGWSLDNKDCEVDQVLKARIIKPAQFHGVEIIKDIHDANVEAWPNLSWHHGDFLEVMRTYPDFNPGLVNADLMAMAETSADYIARILCLLVPFDAILVANFIMEHRGHTSTPEQVLDRLCQCQQFRYAMRNGWAYDGKCYLYDGTGHRSYTVMGTFTFRRVEPLLIEPLTKDRRKNTSGLATAV